jgi:poly(A) polymerase
VQSINLLIISECELIQIAADMTDIIMIKSANWKDLFTKHDFFHRYKYYLQVIASSDSIDNQRIWSALVESRLRHLVLKLEFVENLVLAHPFVHGYDHNVNCYSEQQAIDAGRGIFHDLSQFQPSFVQHAPGVAERTARTVYTTTFYIGLAIEPRPLGVTAPRKLDISWPTSDFTKMCKQWEKYDERSMGICVKYIKRYDIVWLP